MVSYLGSYSYAQNASRTPSAVRGYNRGDTSGSSKQRCCTGVGCVGNEKVPPPSALLTVSVPRSLIKLRKLCTGRSSKVRLLAAFLCAAGNRYAGCTTDDRCSCPASGS